jgi:hypothetical protein
MQPRLFLFLKYATMNKDCPRHIAQEIVDQIFLQEQKYIETAAKTNDSEQLSNIARKRERLIEELRIVLNEKMKPNE